MSAIVKNITVQTISSPIVMGIMASKEANAASTVYGSYTTESKKWYRQASEKPVAFDWDNNRNELEFE